MTPAPRPALALCLLLGALSSATAQTSLSALRDELGQSTRDSGYAAFLTGLTTLGSDAELTGGILTIEASTSIELTPNTMLIPISIDVEDAAWIKLRFEGVGGYVTSHFDLRSTSTGASAFHVSARNSVLAFDLGVGPSFELPFGISIQPLLHGNTAYLSDRARFGGPAGPAVRALTEDLLFDIDAYYAGFGASLAIRQDLQLGPFSLRPAVRYDWRRTFVVQIDHDANDSPATAHWFTTHLDLRGPIHTWTDAEEQDTTLGWLASLGYRLFFDDLREALVMRDYFVLTCGLWLRVPKDTSWTHGWFDTLRLSGSWFIGEKLRGWAFGAMTEF